MFVLLVDEMEGMRKIGFAVGCLMMFIMVQDVSAFRHIVGGNMFWATNVDYSVWANAINFYNGDWLFFVYDRNQHNVLEVNKMDFESCNSHRVLQNWTTGAGRDIVPLNETRTYYFIGGYGYCYGGMKVAIRVNDPPLAPSAAPVKSAGVPHLWTSLKRKIILSPISKIGAVWEAFIFPW